MMKDDDRTILKIQYRYNTGISFHEKHASLNLDEILDEPMTYNT